jgi:2-polyprenyl-3-methyl-5-hydroxy-6-metoxy-1,4-benzoquinol methylase
MTASENWNSTLVDSYNCVAERYAEQFFHELDRKPFDRDLLDRYAATVRGRGKKVCELGCGVGHIARYLHTHGTEMFDPARMYSISGPHQFFY